MKIINFTQHPALQVMKALGVFDAQRSIVESVITFTEIPSQEEMKARAESLAKIAMAEGADAALIGGAPYFMRPLEEALKRNDIKPVYAFTKRISQEMTLPDGSVQKVSKFVFEGFVS